MLEKTFRLLFTLLVFVFAIVLLIGTGALFLFALAAAALVVLTVFVAAPKEGRRFWHVLSDRLDGWLGRIESLWSEVRETLDRWAAMGAQQVSDPDGAQGKEAPVVSRTPAAPADEKESERESEKESEKGGEVRRE